MWACSSFTRTVIHALAIGVEGGEVHPLCCPPPIVLVVTIRKACHFLLIENRAISPTVLMIEPAVVSGEFSSELLRSGHRGIWRSRGFLINELK